MTTCQLPSEGRGRQRLDLHPLAFQFIVRTPNETSAQRAHVLNRDFARLGDFDHGVQHMVSHR